MESSKSWRTCVDMSIALLLYCSREEGDVGVNANDLSHAFNSAISSSPAIRFTEDVVIPRNRATARPCIPISAPPPDQVPSSPAPPAASAPILSGNLEMVPDFRRDDVWIPVPAPDSDLGVAGMAATRTKLLQGSK